MPLSEQRCKCRAGLRSQHARRALLNDLASAHDHHDITANHSVQPVCHLQHRGMLQGAAHDLQLQAGGHKLWVPDWTPAPPLLK
jgi:hypothetical protein